MMMNLWKNITNMLVMFWAVIITFTMCQSDVTAENENIISDGEEIEYEVSFLGIKLGSIKIVSEGMTEINGNKAVKAKAIINSYKGIPFVSLNTIYESWMDPSITFSHQFTGKTKFMSDEWKRNKIVFDYKAKKITNEMWDGDKQLYKNTMKTGKKWNDGLSLFFLARQLVDSKKSVKVPTFIEKDTAYTSLSFGGKRETIEIDAVDYDIKTIYFKGKAEWEGVYGLTGNFEGWFSDDSAHVPIKAKMKVLVGSVTIELIKWKRAGWTPPKGS